MDKNPDQSKMTEHKSVAEEPKVDPKIQLGVDDKLIGDDRDVEGEIEEEKLRNHNNDEEPAY